MASRQSGDKTSTSVRRAALAIAALALCAARVSADDAPLVANPMGPMTIETVEVAEPDPAPIEQPADDNASADQPNPAPAATVNPESLLPLGAQPANAAGADNNAEAAATTSDGGWGVQTALALAAVIGLIFLCKVVFVKLASKGGGTIAAQLGPSGRAPSGLLSVLARYPVGKGSTLVLLRLDRRVLLLSQTNQGFATLAEINDPEEVAGLIMRAEDEEGASLTRRFRSLLTQAERDPELVGATADGGCEITIDSPAMTPRAATARFHDVVMSESSAHASTDADHADAVGSLRNRLRSLREVSA